MGTYVITHLVERQKPFIVGKGARLGLPIMTSHQLSYFSFSLSLSLSLSFFTCTMHHSTHYLYNFFKEKANIIISIGRHCPHTRIFPSSDALPYSSTNFSISLFFKAYCFLSIQTYVSMLRVKFDS